MKDPITGMEMPDPAHDGGPPPITPPAGELAKKAPAALDARLANLDPDLKDYFERTIADKRNAEAKFREVDERLRKTEVSLNERVQREQEAEKKRLEETGEYKKLYEDLRQENDSLKIKETVRTVRETLVKELEKADAHDADYLADAVFTRHKDALSLQGGVVIGVSDVIAKLKSEKPTLFKAPPPPAPPEPTVKPTGQDFGDVKQGTDPTQTNYADRGVSLSETEKAYAVWVRNLPKGN